MDARCVSVQLIQRPQLTKPEEDLKPAGHQSSGTENKFFLYSLSILHLMKNEVILAAQRGRQSVSANCYKLPGIFQMVFVLALAIKKI